jgi:hypothetical protein
MWTIVSDVFGQNLFDVVPAEDEDPIETLSADGAPRIVRRGRSPEELEPGS